MSQVIDLLVKSHQGQLAVAGKSQEGLLEVANQLTELGSKLQAKLVPTSELSTSYAQRVRSVVGTPADYLRFAAQSFSDWAKLNEEFQYKLAATIGPKAVTAAA